LHIDITQTANLKNPSMCRDLSAQKAIQPLSLPPYLKEENNNEQPGEPRSPGLAETAERLAARRPVP
jgi:hypothetical protein